MIPIGTSIQPERTPYANYALIVINVLAFLLTFRLARAAQEPVVVSWALDLMLYPARWRIWQFLTYAFLHGGLGHIIGNMFFLYLFGNNVNDKLGHGKYIVFYLAGAIFSGIGHAVVNQTAITPTLGASGAVAAVTGAYLVLFPQTLIRVLYFFILIGTAELPALWFILIKLFFIDNFMNRSPYVAYDAHISGYAFGIGSILLCLALGVISSSHFDLWAMIQRWNRRRQYRDAVAEGHDPFTGSVGRRAVRAKVIRKTPDQIAKEEEILAIRQKISEYIMQRNLPSAAESYLHLMDVDGEQVLARQQLLDIANQLASTRQSQAAAQAYEQFLAHYGNYEYIEQVMLMLGIIYARYLDKAERAVQCLRQAEQRLTDAQQLRMCREELARLSA